MEGYLPSYIAATGCDLYAFDVRKRRERKLAGVSRPDRSEYSRRCGRVGSFRVCTTDAGAVTDPAAALRGHGRRPSSSSTRASAHAGDVDLESGQEAGAYRGQRAWDRSGWTFAGSTLVYSWRFNTPGRGFPPDRYCPQPLRPDQDPIELDDERVTQVRRMTIGQASRAIAQPAGLEVFPETLLHGGGPPTARSFSPAPFSARIAGRHASRVGRRLAPGRSRWHRFRAALTKPFPWPKRPDRGLRRFTVDSPDRHLPLRRNRLWRRGARIAGRRAVPEGCGATRGPGP